MTDMNIPVEVAEYFATHYPGKSYNINDIDRYENIYAVSFYVDSRTKTAYIPVRKENRMSDSVIS